MTNPPAEVLAERHEDWYAPIAASHVEPGLLTDMSNDEYHAQTDWLSSSQLKALLPEHYKTGGNTDAFAFGTLFHTAVLEPDNLAGYVALDADAIGVKADGTPAQNPTMTAAWKKAVAEVEADGKLVVAQADLDRALAMREAVYAHDTARQLMEQMTAFEESAFWRDENGVQHKARFDGRGPGFIADLKSTSAKPGERSLRYVTWDYGYHLSAAHYLEVAQGLGLDAPNFALIFVTKTAPHLVTVAQVGPERLAEGRDLRERAIRRFIDPDADAYEGARGFITL